MKKRSNIYILVYSLVFLVLLFSNIILIVYIDPYFHYHKPIDGYTYEIDNQHYQNYGILKNFEYDAMITGTSMTENFMTSEFDDLFNVNSIKTSFSGAYYKEIDQAIRFAIEANDSLKMVIRGLDIELFYTLANKNQIKHNELFYPWFLYDYNIFNDVSYVLNKEILISDTIPILYTKGTTGITSFDRYSNWTKDYTFNKKTVLETYDRLLDKADTQRQLDLNLLETAKGNIQQNIVDTISSNPDIDFYYFFTPYSIVWWDSVIRFGTFQQFIKIHELIIESLLPYDNCYLFSFNNEFDITTNLDNYKDIAHYSEDINSFILNQMAIGGNILTYDNYQDYLKTCQEFYLNYDYDLIFE